MMSQGNFIDLRWSSFHGNILKQFEDVRASQDFCDVTLACDDEGLDEAHRIILASGSMFFHKLLSSDRLGSNPVLTIRNGKIVETNIGKLETTDTREWIHKDGK